MSLIHLKVINNDEEVFLKDSKLVTNTLTELISSLKEAKEETNIILSQIVNDEKSKFHKKQIRNVDDDFSEDIEETNHKKHKI